MQYSDGEIIKNIIIEYINDESNEQAILIDGKWGSGKTFFVKNKIIRAIKNLDNKKSNVIYISLYGIKNSKEITDKIHAEILNEKIKLGDKSLKIFGLVGKVTNSTLKSKGIDLDNVSEILEISNFFNIKEYVIIFDDLERCEMGINEVLGYINDLVEHKEVKTIIVANEEQIGKLSLNKNLEQKYGVVLSQRLDLRKKEKDNLINAQEILNSSDKTTISIDELKKHTQELFKTDLIYNEIKEKLIGFTIEYTPNMNEILDDIINNYVKDYNTKEIINRNKSDMIKYIENGKYYNIRTIIFALTSFEKINKVIEEKKFNEEYIDKIKDNIFMDCFEMSIELKNGKELRTWEDDSQVKTVYVMNERWKTFTQYRFIDLFLTKRILDKEKIYEVIENQIKESERIREEKEEKNLSLYKLYDKWWYVEDDTELYKEIKNLEDEVEEGKYKIQDCKSIFILLIQLESHEIINKEDANRIEKIILEQCRKPNLDVRIDSLDIRTQDEYLSVRYSELINPIKQILQDKENEKNIMDINLYIKDREEWIFDFGDYCESQKDIFLEKRQFFNFIDIENLKNVIISSSNRDIYDFTSQLRRVYSFENLNDFFKNDIENLRKFVEALNDEINQITGKTKKIAIECLINDVQKFIEKINRQY